MIKATHDIVNVKKSVKGIIGEDVNVKVNLGRNKYTHFKGKLTAVYPSLFTILPMDGYRGKTSFSYAELMCGNVKIKPIVKE